MNVKYENQETQKENHPLLKRSLQILFRLNDVVHVLVAILLFLAAVTMLGYTLFTTRSISTASIIQVIDNAMFVIIIMELFWTMLRYLKRKSFPLNSFIFIGIISSIRRILLVETQSSFGHGLPSHSALMAEATQMGIYSGVILVLVLSYLILSKLPEPKE